MCILSAITLFSLALYFAAIRPVLRRAGIISREPGAYARADLARIAASLKRYDRRQYARRARERLARLTVVCAGVALCVALFYSATN